MKYWLTFFLLIFFTNSHTQNVNGNWYGTVTTDDGTARLLLTVYEENGKTKSYMASPEFVDGDAVIFDSVSLTKSKMYLSFKKNLKIFANIINDTLITGMFSNNQPSIYRKIRLVKVKSFPDLSKPQTPKPPLSYKSQVVYFKDSITGLTYNGILTSPKTDSLKSNQFPAIILLPGTGSHNMDYSAGSHSWFMVLADYFTRNGYVVLRKDSRFYGDTSKNFESVTLPETVSDAEAALRFLKKQQNIDTTRIGLLGHSEGGVIAPALAVKTHEIKFLVLMAAPAISFKKLVLQQKEVLDKEISDKYLLPIFKKNISPDSIKALTPRLKYLLDYNPATALSKLTIPVLALNGDKDLQVNAFENISAIDSSLQVAKNKKYQTVILPGLNHNFQKCIKCRFKEGIYLDETISPFVLELIGEWLKSNYQIKSPAFSNFLKSQKN